MHKVFIGVSLLFASVIAIIYPSTGTMQEQLSCNISVNRSAVPDLYFNNLTLIVQVNDASDILVLENNESIPFTKTGDQLVITTDADGFSIVLTPGSDLTDLCEVEKAPLLDNKKWAWSHGFDDNVNLSAAIEEFRAKSWPATIFAIAKDYDQERDEGWITDEPYVNSVLLPEGWALGNHSWNHERFETSNPTAQDYLADILDGQTRFIQGVARSPVPDFKVMVFASPNFSSDYDGPFNEATQSTDLKLIETGNDFMLVVTGDEPYSTNEELTAQPLVGRAQIGRDIAIESDPNDVIERIDWMASNGNDSRRFWYNTLAHGDHESSIKAVLDHVWSNYGPDATNEAWVASSTEVYSYILTRDNTTFTVETSGTIPEITPETPSDETTPIYLPMITMMKNWLGIQANQEQGKQLSSVLLKVSGRGMQELKNAE